MNAQMVLNMKDISSAIRVNQRQTLNPCLAFQPGSRSESESRKDTEPEPKYKYPCDMCTLVGAKMEYLRPHKELHLVAEHPCNICNYIGKSKVWLVAHRK